MANLLIKGMKLPEGRNILQLYVTNNGKVFVYTDTFEGDIEEHPNTTAIELPNHGRLIDADKMELDFRVSVANCIKKYPYIKNTYSECERLVVGIINKTPTVVEASE